MCAGFVEPFISVPIFTCADLYRYCRALLDSILFVQKCTDKYSKICAFCRFSALSNHSYNTNCFICRLKCFLGRFGAVDTYK